MALASRTDLEARLLRVRERLNKLELEALLVTHIPNVFYLTGMRASAAAVLVEMDSVTLITDSRYITVARSLADSGSSLKAIRIVQVVDSYNETIREEVFQRKLSRLGVESQNMTMKEALWYGQELKKGTTVEATDGLVEEIRILKDAGEVQSLRHAGSLLASAVPLVLDLVRKGRTERAIAADIDRLLVTQGFEGRAFETIVASGPRSALPHARPGQRRLEIGDLVLLDFGGIYDGYCVDITRAACVGPPGDEAKRLHEAVLEAQTAAIAVVRPGNFASDVDTAARDVLKERDLADAFGHSTGHGLGIELHEAPLVAPVNQAKTRATDVMLKPGMVFTVEPGVYVPGFGGVRIEDDVIVTLQGCDVLTEVSRRLAVG